jgi:hypothetical protein
MSAALRGCEAARFSWAPSAAARRPGRLPPGGAAAAAARRPRARATPRAAAAAAPRRPGPRAAPAPRRAPLLPPAAAIRGFETLDGSVTLDTVSRDLLTWSVSSPAFLADVAAAAGLPPGAGLRFSGQLFQPIPWSPATRHGMPPEMEVRARARAASSRLLPPGRASTPAARSPPSHRTAGPLAPTKPPAPPGVP